MFSVLNHGITGRAIRQGLSEVHYWNPRDFATNKHRNVDDRPYGGGPGMVMMAEPLQGAIRAAKSAAPKQPKVVYLSPQGKPFSQGIAEMALALESIILVAGRYEGIDERLLQLEVDEEWSLGDFILSGGEIPAMAIIDTMIRLIPGALGDEDSTKEESLVGGLLEYPHYTRPENFNGLSVPNVLLNGNHQEIKKWRLQQSLGRTWLKRPALLSGKQLTQDEQILLDEFIKAQSKN